MGPVTLEHLHRAPTAGPPPQMATLGEERGGWEPGWGAPGVSSLVFLERLNGKCLADGMSLTGPQGPPCQNPHPGAWGAALSPAFSPSGHPAAMRLPGCAPLHGEIKVQTVAPFGLGGTREGVSLQDVRHWQRRFGGPAGLSRPHPRPQHGRALGGCPVLPLGPRGWGPISLALWGA